MISVLDRGDVASVMATRQRPWSMKCRTLLLVATSALLPACGPVAPQLVLPDGSIVTYTEKRNSEGKRVAVGFQDSAGKQHGLWTYLFDESGAVFSQGSYDHGLKQGLWIAWHSSGQVRNEGRYVNDVEDGEWFSWREDGTRWEHKSYKRGSLDGEYRSWYDNGQLNTHGFNRAGGHVGKWESWYENGTLRARGEWTDNKQTGPWLVYRADGSVDTDESGVYELGNKIAPLPPDQH